MRKLLLGICLTLFCISDSYSTHLTGGTLTYEHLGGSTYRISLRMFRANDPCVTHYIGDNVVPIDLYTGTGTFIQTLSVPLIDRSPVQPYIDSCAANPPCVDLEILLYSDVITLAPNPGGYFLYHEICCRNSAIDNINNPTGSGPGAGGMGFPCYIPDMTLLLTNSSPQWKNPPPTFVCQGFDIDFDHGATDADGDSLAYTFYQPFSDINYTVNNDLTFTAGSPNLVTVNWLAGFSANDPVDVGAGPGLTVSSTGLISGIPPNLGAFVAGIRCNEYRDGVLIGSIYRDFQFNVVSCPPRIEPVIGESSSCDGDYTVTFSNLSSYDASTTFFWDFDLSQPNTSPTDTSNAISPTYTYPAVFQCYDVMLITQPHTKCADTAYRNICVDEATALFNAPDSVCISTIVNFTDASTGSPGNPVISWSYNFDDGSGSVLPSPTHGFPSSGVYDVELAINTSVGCKDTIVRPIYIQGLPTANAGPDVNSCLNNPEVTLNGSIANAGGGLWVNGAGSYTPSNTSPVTDYLPDTSETVSGTSMYLILTTTGNGLCPAAFDSVQITFVDGPTVDAGPDIQVCRDTSIVPLNGTFTVAGGIVWSTNGSGTFTPSNTNPNASYVPTPADTAAGCITFFLISTFNGNCNPVIDTMELCFYAPPTLVITADDTICTGQPLTLSANTTTGNGYWTTAGDGTYTPDSLLTPTSTPVYLNGPNDETNGSVQFIFVTTNNGGCQAVRDTLNVDVIPSPVPAFTSDQVCFGQLTSLTNASTAVGGIAGYQWITGGAPFSSAPNPTFIFPLEGPNSVSLVISSNNGCVDTVTQNVLINYLPNVAFNNVTPCLQGGTPFNDASTVTGSTINAWEWSFGDGGNSFVQDPIHTYGSSGTYNVQLIATSAQGCVDSLTQPTVVLPPPVAAFVPDPLFSNPFSNIVFTDGSTPVVSWEWDFGDSLGTSTQQNPVYAYNSGGVFPVILTVTDTNGCRDTVVVEVTVFLPPFVPSGFSPNNSGTNDLLHVYGGSFDEIDFKVYNNWGELIYQNTDTKHCVDHTCEGWDGTYKGADQPIGVFVWTLRAVTPDKKVHELHGDVTLIR